MIDPGVERLRRWLVRRTGLWFDDARVDLLADVLARRVACHRTTRDAYLAMLDAEPMGALEVRAIAALVTVHETYFFRNAEQLLAFADAARRRRATGPRPLRILSAGCSTGEEPYTLAMLLLDPAVSAGAPFAIDALDLDPLALEAAERARYSAWSLRATPPAMRARWFRAVGDELALDPAVTRTVRFAQGNLAIDDVTRLPPRTYDAVFCRNVLMYFAPEEARAALARLARSLIPGGLLFLGHAETLRGLSEDFELQHTLGAFYYRLREAPCERRPAGGVATSFALPPAPPVDEQPRSTDWVGDIRRAADRIAALTAPGPERTASVEARAPGAPAATWDRRVVLDHLAHERWDEARAVLDRLPPAAAQAPDVRILRAVLLTHGGDLAAAESACAALLADDDANPDAHYLMALCRESAGDLARAVHHHRTAAELDDRFAMPHLQLGLLARSSGDAATARHELAEALDRLDADDPARLALFGGGFDRAALRQLCRAELGALEGRS